MRGVEHEGTSRRKSASGGDRFALLPGERDGHEPGGPGRLERLDDVGRGAARGQGEGDVSRSAQGLDLTAEDAIETPVVADGGQGGRIGGQGDRPGAAGRSAAAEAVDELGGEMLGLGGAPAVAEGEDLAARPRGAPRWPRPQRPRIPPRVS